MATVLVVDDRSVNRDLVRTILGYEGYDVLEADSGPEALQLVELRAPDLMISDVLMPGMDGYELARAVRALPASSQLPIVFYTANYLEREARPIAAACGVDHVVAKNGDPRALIDAVAQALRVAPRARPSVGEEDFSRAHLHVLNMTLLEKVHELEEKERLNQLVEAAVVVGGDLGGLHTTLHRIVVAARSLVAARFARLEMVDVAGWDLGPVTDGIALRSRDPLTEGSIILLPITSPDGHRGTLELTGRHTEADFTANDRSLLAAFAHAAGTAIGNAHRYDDARRRQAWLRASTEATSMLLSTDPNHALFSVVRSARLVANADIAWIEVADSSVVVVDAPPDPQHDELAPGVASAIGEGLVRDVGETGEPVVIDDAARELDNPVALLADVAGIGPLLAVPLQAGSGFVGVLILGNWRHRPKFSRLDVEMATTFAGHAAVALEFARAQADRERLRVVEERDRIARDLHDVVIQRLFAVGLRLESLCPRLPKPEADQIVEATEELDHTIDDIRDAIFSLRNGGDGAGLRERLQAVIARAEQTLGFAPEVRMEGPIDDVPEPIHLNVLATANEALSNVARHARSSAVQVRVTAAAGELRVVVSDNGRGLPADRQESGLANLRQRAALTGGTMTLEPQTDGTGLVLTWQVPLPTADAPA
ncbi:MAG: hypothetical protein QOG01_4304 [Pseudonocardiales bacterium]|nr:hypothetical protein [Pseudonocardiales bacterium]